LTDSKEIFSSHNLTKKTFYSFFPNPTVGEARSYINIYSNPVEESPTRSILLSLIG